ncbi:MAG: hypothetical protein ACPGRX_07750, partial [Bdellovibrionales bacterium]
QKQSDKNAFIIRLTTPVAMTGCIDLQKPGYDILDAGQIIYITLTEGSVSPAESPRYATYDCTIKSGVLSTDIPLDRKHLAQNGAQKIILKSETAGPIFDIAMTHTDIGTRFETELKIPTGKPERDGPRIFTLPLATPE